MNRGRLIEFEIFSALIINIQKESEENMMLIINILFS